MSIVKALRKKAEPVNVAEIAKLFSVTAGTVQRWVRLRQIPCIRIGDTIRFDPGTLADWLEAQAACTFRPRAPEDPDTDPLHWQELAPEEFRKQKDDPQ